MKKNKRNFIKFMVSIIFIPLFAKASFIKNNYIKKITLKRKFSKVWLLDINDN